MTLGKGPRPLDYVRIRVYRGGQAEYLKQLLEDEKANLFDDLGRMRGEGRNEDDREVLEVATSIRHIIQTLRDLDTGIVELVGPDGW